MFGTRQRSALGLCLLMFGLSLAPLASAAISAYTGPAVFEDHWQDGEDTGMSNHSWVAGNLTTTTQPVTFEGFRMPMNATALDGDLSIDPMLRTSAGNGTHFIADDPVSNFSLGTFEGTSVDVFDGALTLDVNQSVGRVDDLEELTLRFTDEWQSGGTAGVWGPLEPGQHGGPFAMGTSARQRAGGLVPSLPLDGTTVATTMPLQSVPAGTHAWLTGPTHPVPRTVNNWTLGFQHWVHLPAASSGGGSTGDGGAWVEASLDGGLNWRWIEPVGGYPHATGPSAPLPLGAPGFNNSSTGLGSIPAFGGAADPGWNHTEFDLSQLPVVNATGLTLRFVIWTDPLSPIDRPGWFIDAIELSNDGAPPGAWFHGSLTGEYAADAHAILQMPVELGPIQQSGGQWMLRHWTDFDLEGGSWDNYHIWVSNDNLSWYRVTYGGGVPGPQGAVSGGVTYTSDTGGWIELAYPLPAAFTPNANGSILLRFEVETDALPGSGYGGNRIDAPEGVFIDDISFTHTVGMNTTTRWTNTFSTPGQAWHAMLPGASYDQWQYLSTHGNAGPWAAAHSFENGPLVADGWAVETPHGVGWSFGQVNGSSGFGPAAWPSGNVGAAMGLDGRHAANTWSHLISDPMPIPSGASARIVFDHFICAETGWDGGALFGSTDAGLTWFQVGAGDALFYDTQQWNNGQSPLYGMWAWDGSNKKNGTCGSNKAFETVEADVSHLAGASLTLRFSFFSDTYIEYDGWYIDDVGLEVDWFESNGSWTSPPIHAGPFGYDGFGFQAHSAAISGAHATHEVIDAATGEVLSINGTDAILIDPDEHPAVQLRLHLSTADMRITPKVGRAWHGPAFAMDMDGGQNWTNGGLADNLLSNPNGRGHLMMSSLPVDAVNIEVVGAGYYLSLWDADDGGPPSTRTQWVSQPILAGMLQNGTYPLPREVLHLNVQVVLQPGGWIHALSIEAARQMPISNATLDIAADGAPDWAWGVDAGRGMPGFQTQMTHEGDVGAFHRIQLSAGEVTTLEVRLPNAGTDFDSYLGIQTGQAAAFNLTDRYATTEFEAEEAAIWFSEFNSWDAWAGHGPQWLPNGSEVDPDHPDRLWDTQNLTIEAVSDLDIVVQLRGVLYNLAEEVDDLGPVLRASAADTLNGTGAGMVNAGDIIIPVSVELAHGGLGLAGNMTHAMRIENQVTSLPFGTMIPMRNVTLMSQHIHLISADLFTEVNLTLQPDHGEAIHVEFTWDAGEANFTQTTGAERLTLIPASCQVQQMGAYLTLAWAFTPQWAFDDVDRIEVLAEAFEVDGFGLGPGHGEIGGSNHQAMENDLEITRFEVRDERGRSLSNTWDARYPFHAMAETALVVSGDIRFQGQGGTVPADDAWRIAIGVVDAAGEEHAHTTTRAASGGEWILEVPLPESADVLDLRPYIVQLGPLGTSAFGVEDATPASLNATVKVDDAEPEIGPLMIHTALGGQPADGNVVGRSATLPLYIDVSDDELLGNAVTLHSWVRAHDDADQDGQPDPDEYQTRVEILGGAPRGTMRIQFPAISIIGASEGDRISLYVTGGDFAGHPFQGGGPGFAQDLATLTVEGQEQTQVVDHSIALNRHAGMALLTGVAHTFSFDVHDLNGVDSIDRFTLHLAGEAQSPAGTMHYDPLGDVFHTPEASSIIPLEARKVDLGDHLYRVTLTFAIAPDAPGEWKQGPWSPDLIVSEDGAALDLGLTGLDGLAWALDDRWMWVLEEAQDLTAPAMEMFDRRLNLQPDDDFRIHASIRHRANGAPLAISLDHMPVEAAIRDAVNAENHTLSLTENAFNHSFTAHSHLWPGPNADFIADMPELAMWNVSLPAFEFDLRIDSTAPQIEFQATSLVMLQTDLLADQLVSFTVMDDGGMGDEGVTLHWTFQRDGEDLAGAQGALEMGLGTWTGAAWTYTDYVDFTPPSGTVFAEGDRLLVWVSGADHAGNALEGPGTEGRPRIPALMVMQFDAGIATIDHDAEKPEVGDWITVDVRVRNTGNIPGQVAVDLWAWEMRGGEEIRITMAETETVALGVGESKLVSFTIEAWREGDLQLYIVLDQDAEERTAVELPRIREMGASETLSDQFFGGMGVGIIGIVGLILGFGLAFVVLGREEEWPEPPAFFPDEEPPPLPPGLEEEE